MAWPFVDVVVLYGIQFLTMFRAITRENRAPSSRVAWMLVILALPGLGVLFYFLLGEATFGRRAVARMRAVIRSLPTLPGGGATPDRRDWLSEIPVHLRSTFSRAAVVNSFALTSGNRAELMESSDATITRLIEDIDQARDHVHILVYIWLDDNNGRRLLAAVERAARRGVTCRCLVDGLGSRQLIGGEDWKRLLQSGGRGAVAFNTRWPALRMMVGRIDIRNHRKIIVVDGQISYCGSQNCADPAFLIKARFAPWVDIMLRLDGPVTWQAQQLFVTDWTSHTGEKIADVLARPPQGHAPGFHALAMGTGPEISQNAVPDVFIAALSGAQHEVTITTPYFVPSMALLDQLRAAALRGVRVTMILPKTNDSRFVGHASRSFYLSLLRAGVSLFEFRPGLLHSKTLTLDGDFALIGSANLDRRSFELNFENNLLIHDRAMTALIRGRQRDYMALSDQVTLAEVENWSWRRRLLNNLAGTMAPLL